MYRYPKKQMWNFIKTLGRVKKKNERGARWKKCDMITDLKQMYKIFTASRDDSREINIQDT